jgi:CTP synthase (UTP-ammonia lyase)
MQTGVMFFIFAVVPHITDAIQEWVERVANQPVTEDGTKPQVGG